jgi:pimeloyl-ACP methyl ester carboxylesterase
MVRLYTEELVYTETEDGIILAGLVIWPDGRPAKPIAVVWVPGFSINFYHPSFVAIGRELAGLGYAFVIGNNRGHDIGAHLWRKKEDADGMTRTYGGAFWERFEDSPRDVAAWIGFALSLGFQGVGLVGHSFGAKKVVYYQARRQDPRVSGLVVASTPIAAPALDPELVALSEQMMAGGRGMELLPWGSLITFFVGTLSAQTYLSRVPDLFGVSSAHAEIGKIRCPLLVCCGTNESDDPALSLETIQAHETIRHKAAASPKVDVAMFEGANHGYDNHEGEVAEALAHWIDTLP